MKLSGVPGGTVLGSRATWTIQEPSGARECSPCSLCACARGVDMRNGRASAPTINEARTTPLTFIGLLSPFVWLYLLIIRFVLSLFVCCFRLLPGGSRLALVHCSLVTTGRRGEG